MNPQEELQEAKREALKDKIHSLIFQIYRQYGLKAAREKAYELIKECELPKYNAYLRGILKGELGESILEAHLLEFQHYVKPSIVIKGLCIPSRTGKNKTTEMDLAMFTKQRVYLFECKSYSGKKTLTKECFLKAKASSKDVFAQSVIHMEILNQYLNMYRINTFKQGEAPYKLYLFEMSSNDIEDKRTSEWQKRIPALTLRNIEPILAKEFTTPMKVNWDIERMLPLLERLSKQSKDNFKIHMSRMYNIQKHNKG